MDIKKIKFGNITFLFSIALVVIALFSVIFNLFYFTFTGQYLLAGEQLFIGVIASSATAGMDFILKRLIKLITR